MAERRLRFDDKVVVVTGGSRGIGRDIVRAFAEVGAKVVTCGRTPPEDEIPATFHACDVRKADQVEAMFEAIGAEHGHVDVVINNAGGSPHADAATASPRFSESIIALNLLAPLHVSRAAHQWLAKAPGQGSIINIASVSAVRPSPGTSAYAAAKTGLLGLTRSLAQEWAPKIRVNAIIAGLIGTEDAAATYGSEDIQNQIIANQPIGRLGSGDDIASACLFMASDYAGYVNGAAWEVDGGGEVPPFFSILKAHGVA
ncbi:NAD(P)-dependent dehydrogenase, short-chain alcohol dehydrogenase family [Sphingomonas laterariae]|uniref:NAD(P)-dependent dehydrogenase, short-chain alcohol dehydrogenase family n=1 Tax=Edaphosphingomonas laterariae TaxID=861865 RepID=A0A239D6V3_9SPHN|nr:SDR family oxidoreductase [Sphingomonas laterariae]SNS27594.1 NAD(P)-dependent dehydrogenase, short-chain alcohol dehydrogenase family [Sphingomonas laterariae]